MKQPKELMPELWIRDVETIKVFADALRLEILRLMSHPTTVKHIADILQMPATKLYYHIRLLLQHGLIQEVDQNLESGIVEKIYQVTARQFKIVNPLLGGDALPEKAAETLLLSMLNETTRDFQQAFQQRDKREGAPPRHPFFSKKEFRLTDRQLTEFHAKLDGLIKEVTALEKSNAALADPLYELTVAFYQQPTASAPAKASPPMKAKWYFPPSPEFQPSGIGWRMTTGTGRMRLNLSDQPGSEL